MQHEFCLVYSLRTRYQCTTSDELLLKDLPVPLSVVNVVLVSAADKVADAVWPTFLKRTLMWQWPTCLTRSLNRQRPALLARSLDVAEACTQGKVTNCDRSLHSWQGHYIWKQPALLARPLMGKWPALLSLYEVTKYGNSLHSWHGVMAIRSLMWQ